MLKSCSDGVGGSSRGVTELSFFFFAAEFCAWLVNEALKYICKGPVDENKGEEYASENTDFADFKRDSPKY